MVDQRTGSGRLAVRRHFDHMKRATVLNQTYFHQVDDKGKCVDAKMDEFWKSFKRSLTPSLLPLKMFQKVIHFGIHRLP